MLADAEEALAIREAFERADRDGEGILSVGELSNIFREIDQSWTEAELEALFDAADSNGVGFIRYREFADWLMQDDEREEDDSQSTVDASGRKDVPKGNLRWGIESRLLCICHGKPEWWDRSRQPKGAARDPALCRDGEMQAQCLAQRLFNEEAAGLDVLICGPMRRVLGTAERLASGSRGLVKRAICHAQLCEHGNDPHDFDASSISATFPRLFGTEARHEVSFVGFGGGSNSSASTPARVAGVANWLREESKGWREGAVIGIVGHQAIFDCLYHILANGDASRWDYSWPALKMEKAALSEIHLGADGAKIVRLNDISHLQG